MLLLNIFYQWGFSYWFVEMKFFYSKANARRNREGFIICTRPYLRNHPRISRYPHSNQRFKNRKGRDRWFLSQKENENIVFDVSVCPQYLAFKAQVLSEIPSDFMVTPKRDHIIFFKEQDGPFLVPNIPKLNSVISEVFNFFSKKDQ